MPRLCLMAGAHKTATSHLQHSLIEARAALAERGVAVVAPKTLRADLSPLSHMMRDGVSPQIPKAGAAAFLDLHAQGADRVLLMDENLLGSTDRKMLYRKGRLYPWAENRLPRMLELFDGVPAEVAIAVRSPASFLPSCWSESLHHQGYRPFGEFVEGIDPAAPMWSGLFKRLRKALPETKLVVWRYEDYAALFPALTGRLCGAGAGAGPLTPADRVMRPGISAEAVDWLERQPRQDKDTILTARKRFPKGPDAPGYYPWSAQDHARIEKGYEADMRAAEGIFGVEWLRP